MTQINQLSALSRAQLNLACFYTIYITLAVPIATIPWQTIYLINWIPWTVGTLSWDTLRLLNTHGQINSWTVGHIWKLGRQNTAETLEYPIGERLDTLKTWKDIRQFRQLSIQQLVILQTIGHKWTDIRMDSWSHQDKWTHLDTLEVKTHMLLTWVEHNWV